MAASWILMRVSAAGEHFGLTRPAFAWRTGLGMRKLFAGLTLVGPLDIVIKLTARIERETGFHWIVEDMQGSGTDEIPESELLDESVWR